MLKRFTLRVFFLLEVTRWMEAINPPRDDVGEGEAIYEEWDTPQVQVIHPYQSAQSDELSLAVGDVISVLRKLPDGKKVMKIVRPVEFWVKC